MEPHQVGAVSGSPKVGKHMENDAEQEMDVDWTDRSQENDRDPSLQVAGKMSKGSTHGNYEEEMEGDMCDVMIRFFVKDDTSARV